MIRLNDASAVLVAKNLNLAIFQQVWLIENGVITKDEFGSNSFFSPVAVNVPSEKFDFLAVPEKVQVVVKSEFEKSQQLFARIIGRIVGTLPHTPIIGLGLNFNYFLSIENQEKFGHVCRSLIVSDKNPFRDEFNTDDARFGFYTSKNFLDSRLKLDVKPVKQEGREEIYLNFNFHHETKKPEDVASALQLWDKKHNYTRDLCDLFNKAMEGI